jgi:hypothetical protein
MTASDASVDEQADCDETPEGNEHRHAVVAADLRIDEDVE